MTLTRQLRHKARAERAARDASTRTARVEGGPGTLRIDTSGSATGVPVVGRDSLGEPCTCWVRHGQPRPHSATCPSYVHATGPIGDPSDLIR